MDWLKSKFSGLMGSDQSSEQPTSTTQPIPGTAPELADTVGGRHRRRKSKKTRRGGRKGPKRVRTGRRSTRL